MENTQYNYYISIQDLFDKADRIENGKTAPCPQRDQALTDFAANVTIGFIIRLLEGFVKWSGRGVSEDNYCYETPKFQLEWLRKHFHCVKRVPFNVGETASISYGHSVNV